jgi:hypothetical protein
MTKKKHLIKVVKVPLPKSERLPNRPQAFTKMPRLYLELLENKEKVKQDLINKEYVPSNSPGYAVNHDNSPSRLYEMNKKSVESFDMPNKDDFGSDKSVSEKSLSIRSYGSGSVRSKSDRSYGSDKSVSVSDKSSYTKKSVLSDESDLSYRLKELLQDSDKGSTVSNRDYDKGDKYSVERHRKRHERYKEVPESYTDKATPRNTKEAPTLAEIEAAGGYTQKKELRNINYVSTSEQEDEDAKRELLHQFEVIKKAYPNATIPEFNIHSDHHTMKKSYEGTLRSVSLDTSVDSYKQYLIGGFMLVEFVFGNWLGFDMEGFTTQQLVSMSSYDRLLIELGEKSYVPEGSRWPVELRLLFLIIMNAAFFIVSRMIAKKTGADVLNMVNSLNRPSRPSGPAIKKRRMKEPDVDIDDLPDLDDNPNKADNESRFQESVI